MPNKIINGPARSATAHNCIPIKDIVINSPRENSENIASAEVCAGHGIFLKIKGMVLDIKIPTNKQTRYKQWQPNANCSHSFIEHIAKNDGNMNC